MGTAATVVLGAVLILAATRLVPGEPRTDTLVPDANGGLRVFEFESETDGTFVVDVESFEFDASLRVVDMAANWDATDSAAGAGSNPRLSLHARRGVNYRVEVGREDGSGGAFTIVVRPAADAPAAPTESDEAAWFERAAKRAFEKNEHERGLVLLYEAGTRRLRSGAAEAARDDFAALRTAARAQGNAVFEVLALGLEGASERRACNEAAALPLLEGALAALKTTAVDPNFGCFVLDHLGEAQLALGQAADALATFERFTIAADAIRPALAALSWSRRARALRALGRIDDARAAHASALACVERASPPEPDYDCQVRLHYGSFLEEQDEHDAALAELERGLAIVTDRAWDVRIDLLGASCSALLSLGRFEEARARFAELEAASAKHRLPAQALKIEITAAVLAYRLGELAVARARLLEVLPRLAGAGSDGLRTQALLMLALVELDERRFDDASARLAEAETLCVAAGDRAAAERWRVHVVQAQVARERGDLDEANRLHALVEAYADAHGDDEARATAHAGLAYVALLRGRLDDAQRLAAQSVREFSTRKSVEKSLNPIDTLARVEVARGALDAADLHVARAAELLDRREVRMLGSLAAAGVRARNAQFGELALDIALARWRADPARAEALEDVFMRAGAWKGRALREGLEAATVATEPPHGSAAVMKCLSDGQALVEFAEGTDEMVALVLQRGALRVVPLGHKRAVFAATDAYLAAILARAQPAVLMTLGAAAHERFAALFAELADDVEDLVVVPTPSLAQFPFDAIVLESPPASAGGRMRDATFVLDRYRVVHCPSTQVFADLHARAPRAGAARVLLAGDPIAATETGAARTGIDPDRLLPRVEGTRRELLGIARRLLLSNARAGDAKEFAELAALEVARSGSCSSESFDVYLGAECSRARIASDLTRYSILHLATHGIVNPSDPRRTGLLLTDDGSGDGLLRLDDVLRVRLDADLVVLSACATARGRVVRGEGVESLAWAFLRAGSRSVVATLWKIDDEATAGVMTDLYDSLRHAGSSPARAICAAKRKLRHAAGRGIAPQTDATGDVDRGADPWIWAPFIDIGSTR